VEDRLSVTEWFRPAFEQQSYQLQAIQAKNTRFVSSNDRDPDCPFHLLLLNGCGFCRFPNSPLLPGSGIRAARNGQSFAKYAPSAFTDEVNCIVDNEKQKALLVGVRSPRACVTMPSAAN
jgi:hypothetical protein